MGATKLDLRIEQGSDFSMVVAVSGGPSSLIGYTGAMQIRANKISTVVLYEVDPAAIVIDDAARQVTITLPWVESVDFDWDAGLYDLVITSADELDAYRLVEGKVTVNHAVTRADA